MGTAVKYEHPTTEQLPELKAVLKRFPELGGKVLDTAHSYGDAEIVVGNALAELGNRDKYFLATKVGRPANDRASAAAQIDDSFKRLRTDRVDLLQIWNMSNPDEIAPLLEELKASKRIRYTGFTTSFKQQYAPLEDAMRKHKLDFLQVDLAIDNRSAQDRLIPAAADLGMAVLINLPFGRTRVLPRVARQAGAPVGDGVRREDVAADSAQVHRVESRRYVRHSGYRRGGLRRGQQRRGARSVAGCGDAEAHRAVLRSARLSRQRARIRSIRRAGHRTPLAHSFLRRTPAPGTRRTRLRAPRESRTACSTAARIRG